jgi:sugar/nucleoside kinase (ribokinase family)
MKEYDVVGFGNSILDITINVDEEFLAKNDLKKGNLHLISKEQSEKLTSSFKDKKLTTSPGGSVSNIIAGVAIMGGKSAYIGGLGDDSFGIDYLNKTKEIGVNEHFIKKKNRTGLCAAFITPDGERTFAVDLGECNVINESEIEPNFKTKILMIEGFKLESGDDYNTAIKLIKHAKENNSLIALDVNDSGVIERMGEKLKNFIKEYVDILFMNEMEALALTGKSNEESIELMKDYCPQIVLKIGEEGSFVFKDEKLTKIKPKKLTHIKNTNGAGDAYAAAFLLGITKGLSIEKVGELASHFAASVVSIEEARHSSLPDDIKELLN